MLLLRFVVCMIWLCSSASPASQSTKQKPNNFRAAAGWVNFPQFSFESTRSKTYLVRTVVVLLFVNLNRSPLGNHFIKVCLFVFSYQSPSICDSRISPAVFRSLSCAFRSAWLRRKFAACAVFFSCNNIVLPTRWVRLLAWFLCAELLNRCVHEEESTHIFSIYTIHRYVKCGCVSASEKHTKRTTKYTIQYNQQKQGEYNCGERHVKLKLRL